MNSSHSHVEHTGGANTASAGGSGCAAGMLLPVHPAERSSQVDCFTQLTEENKRKMGYLFPLSILQASRA